MEITNKFEFSKTKILAFSMISIIMFLAIIEGSSWVLLKFITPKDNLEENIVFNPFHPYYAWEHAPELVHYKNVRTDKHGYSETPLKYEKPELKIAITGGSTMFGVGSTESSQTMPSHLERLIFEKLGIKAEVTNLGVRGHQSYQEFLRLREAFIKDKFDLVLSITGRNDAFYGLYQPAIEASLLPDFNRHKVNFLRRIERGENVSVNESLRFTGVREKLLHRINTFRALQILKKRMSTKIVAKTKIEKKMNSKAEGDKPISENQKLAIPDAVAKEKLKNLEFRTNVSIHNFELMKAISEANGSKYMMILQPTAFFKNHHTDEEKTLIQKDNFRQEESGGIPKNTIQAFYENSFYKRIRKAQKSFTFVDLSLLFEDSVESLYIDKCHYNDRGALLLADRVLEAIKPSLSKIGTFSPRN